MFYFKFIYNFIYLTILFFNIKNDNNKNEIFLDGYINFNKVFLDMNIDDDYNNIIGYEFFLSVLDYFNL
tara:strand:+ start:53 stop:259 length:207 start_codon:yes stop_codon:yes gene_type:complete